MIFFKNLEQHKNILHGVLERKDGSVNPFSNAKAEENVLWAVKDAGHGQVAVDNLIFADQPHGNNVYHCPSDIGGYIKLNTDGLISASSGQVLVVKTADCLPILIYDPEKNQVAAIHAGRKGLIKGIIENATIALNSNIRSLIVGIGPHIKKCCYHLKEQDKEIKDSKWQKYSQERDGKYYFDLTQIAFEQLQNLGIKKENIEDMGICTFCEAERFFSARKRDSQPDFYTKEKDIFPCFGSFIGLKT
ncbi:MAG: peptidoglycan editing factor PgeF [Patescibacteria group bacterium]